MSSNTEVGPALAARRTTRLTAIGIAVVAAVLVWGIALLAGVELTVQQPSGAMEIGILPVVVLPAVAGLAGWALLAALERYTPRAKTAWTVGAVVFVVASLVGPLMADAPIATRLTLAAMHLVVGGIVIPLFRRHARSA